MRRVAVTGIGAVTPIGSGADELWAGVLANREVTVRLGEYRSGWLRGIVDTAATPADQRNLTATGG